jgi:hypothetical protein
LGTQDADLSEFESLNGQVGTTSCSIMALSTSMTEEQWNKFSSAMRAPMQRIQHRAIVRWLQQLDISVNKDTIRRHRVNECIACRKSGVSFSE